MKTRRIRIYCGPSLVNATAAVLSQRYVHVYVVGTEHIYVETDKTVEQLMSMLPTWKYGDFMPLELTKAL